MDVRTTLRIPGNWSHPGELIDRLPAGFRLTPEALILPDGTEIDVDSPTDYPDTDTHAHFVMYEPMVMVTLVFPERSVPP